MATIAQVEKRIADIEGFDVKIRHLRDRRDVRGDKGRIRQYPYRRALKHSKNVGDWKMGRFAGAYPGFDVDIMHADGRVAHGRTLLGTVRDAYLDSD